MLLMLSLDSASSQKEAEERLQYMSYFYYHFKCGEFFKDLIRLWGSQFAPPMPPPFQRLSAND
jgi:hypothetical protein